MQNDPNLPIENYPVGIPSGVLPRTTPPLLNRTWFRLTVIFLILFIITGIIFSLIPSSSITIYDQPLGKTIAVKKLVLTKGGFLMIRTANRYNKPSGRNIATTEYLPTDTYNNFTIDIYHDQSNEYPLKLQSGDLLFAIAFEDSDRDFKISTSDAIMKDRFNKQIIKSFRLK